MSDFQLSTPVALFIFNRPKTTIEVLKAIRKAKPDRLFIIADGPRDNNTQDEKSCETARSIINLVDWPCEVLTSFSDRNLGCGVRPATGVSWVFEHVEEAIFLEDDCVPHPSFFRYCQELLEKYRNDKNVMHISGCNFLLGRYRPQYSYYFSRYSLSGGWATWKRAWESFDFDLKVWPDLRMTNWLQNLLNDQKAVWYWKRTFDFVHNGGKAHIWDYQWLFTCWLHESLCVTPSVNLISNIGYGADATHTHWQNKFSRIPIAELHYPLQHPPAIERDIKADQIRQNDLCPSIAYIRAKEILKKFIRKG
ncbi:MAG: glycosyltransferase family 2 protein [Acidobacteria bacterium]|nr:glycosyltransferase family 2 protein [Acidobacteriota bacterium]